MSDARTNHDARAVEGSRRTRPDESGSLLLAGAGRVDARQLVDVAARLVPHGHHCGLSVARRDGRPRTVAATGDLPLEVDTLQHETGDGPFLDALRGEDLVVSHDLCAEERWPRFAPRCARELGVNSLLSVRLLLSPGERAALSFYSRERGAFDDLDLGMGAVLAPYATLVVQQELTLAGGMDLGQALSSTRQVGTAVGIVMATHRVGEDDALRLLSVASQGLGRRLRDVALDVVDTGALPERVR